MKIKKYILPYSTEDIEFVNNQITNILKSGYLTDGGKYVNLVESKWANYVGTKEAIAVNSCTTALELALRVIDVTNKSVIVPTYTFFATPLSVHNAGGKVIYADIDQNTLSLSLKNIKEKITPDTKVVILVHVGGYITDEIFEIKKYCSDHNIILIEDAACAHGSIINNNKAGSIGDISTFSFHHSKVLTSGEGGFINTNNSNWASRLRRMRSIGLDRNINNWEVFEIGNNYKMSEITAAIALLHINKADKIISERRELAKYYDQNIQFNKNFKKLNTSCKNSYYKYVIFVNKNLKQKLYNYLKDANIELPPAVYSYMCSNQNINTKINSLNYNDKFKAAQNAIDTNLCLPMYNGITNSERIYIVEQLNNFIKKYND